MLRRNRNRKGISDHARLSSCEWPVGIHDGDECRAGGSPGGHTTAQSTTLPVDIPEAIPTGAGHAPLPPHPDLTSALAEALAGVVDAHRKLTAAGRRSPPPR